MKGFFPADGLRYEVVRVIDGDTLVIKTAGKDLTVRVIGIDTPETVHPGRPVEPGGPEATARARQLLEGQTITIHYDPSPKHDKLDKYKRLLAYIELPDGRDFGLVMIQEGFARVYLDYPFTRQALYLGTDENTITDTPVWSLTMTTIWKFVRHNSGIVIGSILAIALLVWCYGCPSQVTSITNAPELVTRAELDTEVDYFLEMAEIRYAELDQQDEFKRAIFAVAIAFLEGGGLSPGAIALILGNILGAGAVVDNVRKRTVIETMKSERENSISTS